MTDIQIRGLAVAVAADRRPILHGIDLDLTPGTVLGIVGESGSGKSTLGLAMLGYARPGTVITAGSVTIDGRDLLALDAVQLRRRRGKTVAYVPQDPGTALNPALSLRTQLTEVIGTGAEQIAHIRGILTEVGLPSDDAFLARKPRELSGGQQQRIGIAMAIAPNPALLVLDEPTTGLDVTTQLMVLELVARLTASHSMAAVYITHDLGVVGRVADRIAVVKDGVIVEQASTDAVLRAAQHPYTRALVRAVPSLQDYRDRVPATIQDAPALTVSGLTASYGRKQVLFGVDLEVRRGECLAVVGESGSGKSTMSRCLIGLHGEMTGTLRLGDAPLARTAGRRTRDARRRMQYIFQNPYASLQPRRTVGESIALPLRRFGIAAPREIPSLVAQALERVQLPASFADRYPSELSGGQRQRVAIARALASNPEVLICDEITSALDVSVQASILELLAQLQRDGLAMVFITHNLSVVSTIADRVAVLQNGRVAEQGTVAEVFGNPQQPYTRELLANTLDIADFRSAAA